MKIWSRTKLEYATLDDKENTLTSKYNGEPKVFNCAHCGKELTIGVDTGYVSHLYVPDESEHDSEWAFIICKSCMDEENKEERDMVEKYGTYNLPEPIED